MRKSGEAGESAQQATGSAQREGVGVCRAYKVLIWPNRRRTERSKMQDRKGRLGQITKMSTADGKQSEGLK